MYSIKEKARHKPNKHCFGANFPIVFSYTRARVPYIIYRIFPLAFLNSTRKFFSGYLALWYEKTYYLCGIRLKHRRYEKSSYSI